MDRTSQPYVRGDLVIVIDCADLGRAARFWSAVLGYIPEGDLPAGDAEDAEDAGQEVDTERLKGRTYFTLHPRDDRGIEILLQRTDDTKVAKNRLHLDLRARDLDKEVDRVTSLGATLRTEAQNPVREYGWTWHVLDDPDGNEFCVLQPPDAYWAGR